jgi:anti-anti-sigma factor
MPIESQTIDGRCVCRISGGLNIWEAAAVWERILPLLSAAQPLIVDLSGIDACDGAGIQILCQLRRAADNPGIPVALTGASTAVTTTMKQAGIDFPQFDTADKEA